MVPNRWYVIAESREIPQGEPVGMKRFGESWVLWRDGERLFAASDLCPHRGAALSAGRVVSGQIECPFHGFLFEGEGACAAIPAGCKIPPAMKLDTREVREAHGWVYMWYGEARGEHPPIPWFEDMEDLPTSWFADDWPVHWTRAVENQLDYSHLAFVHKTTIGKFTTAEAQMQVEVEPDRIRAFGGADRNQQFIEWVAPNIWRNKIGPNMWVQAAFVPIDDQTARTYVRFAQGLIKLPWLGEWFCWLMNPMNKLILRQDRDVVVTQRPIVGEIGNGDRLLAIDEPIAAFRAWRSRERMRVSGGEKEVMQGR